MLIVHHNSVSLQLIFQRIIPFLFQFRIKIWYFLIIIYLRIFKYFIYLFN